MSTRPPYMPDGQVEFNQWLLNFSTLISKMPSRYGLTEGEAADVAATTAEWSKAYLPVTLAVTKTAVTVAAKDTARVMAEFFIRRVAQQIAANFGVSAGDKLGLGLNPRISTRTPIRPPQAGPVLSVSGAGVLTINLCYHKLHEGVSNKAKPPGVTGCQIFAATSATPVRDPHELPLKMIATKSPLQLRFQGAEGNRVAYFAARWAVRTGGVSPWSQIVSFTVPNGG